MHTQSPEPHHTSTPTVDTAFRRLRLLVGTYLALSALTLIAAIVLRNDTTIITTAVWIRGTIVVASAILMLILTLSAARGSRGAFLRLRIVSAAMVVAIATIIAIPGMFPLWMKIEQAVCGVLLLGVVALVNGKHLRSLFTTRQAIRA